MEEILNQIIDHDKDDLIAFLQKLIQYNSVLTPVPGEAENAPFGIEIAKALQFVLDKGEQMGFSVQNIDGFAGTVDFGHSGDLIGAMAHIDIVPAGEGWTYPPFEGVVADGRIYGRGSVDDKGPLAATLYAMCAIVKSGLPVSNRFRLIIGTDEETAFRGLEYYLKKEPPLVAGFSPDGEFPVIYGEKGGMQLSCEASWADKNQANDVCHVISVHAGDRVNVVPNYAICQLKLDAETLRLTEQVWETIPNHDKYQLSLKNGILSIAATGTSAHAATPWQGENALGTLLGFLRNLPLSPEGAKDYLYAISDLFGGTQDGSGTGVACKDEMSTPLTLCLASLHLENGCAISRFDLRYPLSKTEDEIFEAVRKAAFDRGLYIIKNRSNKPLYIPKDNPLVQSLLTSYREVTGRTEPPITIGGGTYCREMPGTVAFGPVFPGEREMAHEVDEYITVDNLITCAKIYAQAIYKLIGRS